mmetsp:Transcript_17637/g.31896  ORF Transcript_17637/g.31896 Transcript_17637/m.31896 type:complete len:140 (+) Transcript_17637:163-582(+)
MGFIDDCGVAIPHEDELFFCDEFNRLAKPFGYHLNPYKTRILISTSGLSSLSAVEREYGMEVTVDVRKAIRLYSTEATKLEDIQTNMPRIIQQYDSTMVNDTGVEYQLVPHLHFHQSHHAVDWSVSKGSLHHLSHHCCL